MKKLILGLGLCALSGCAQLLSDTTAGAVLGSVLANQSAGANGDLRSSLTRVDIDAIGGAALLVDVPSEGATALLGPVGTNGAQSTWMSADGVSLTLNQGIMVASRGMGFDMMGASIGQVHGLLSGQVAETTRSFDFIGGNDQITTRTFTCHVSERDTEAVTILDRQVATQKIKVRCEDANTIFTNIYWMSGDRIVKSRQLLSPEVGYIRIEML